MSEPKDFNNIKSTQEPKITLTLNLTELKVFEMIQSGKMGTEKLAIAVEL